mgnify:CR=1 FL=1
MEALGGEGWAEMFLKEARDKEKTEAVSYTHLTLPTSDLV